MNNLQQMFANSGWLVSKVEVQHDATEYAVKIKRNKKYGWFKSLLKKVWR